MIGKGKNRWIYLLAIGIGLGALFFLYLDPYLSKLCAKVFYPFRTSIKTLSRLLSPPLHITLWSVLYLTAKYRAKRDAFFFISRQVLYSLLTFLPLVYGLKILFGRARPELLVDNIYGFYGIMQNHHYHSFPSGHAAVTICMLVPLACTFPKFRIPLTFLFIGLSSTRVLLNYHYVSDILGSIVICSMLQEFYRKYMEKKRKSDLYNPIS